MSKNADISKLQTEVSRLRHRLDIQSRALRHIIEGLAVLHPEVFETPKMKQERRIKIYNMADNCRESLLAAMTSKQPSA